MVEIKITGDTAQEALLDLHEMFRSTMEAPAPAPAAAVTPIPAVSPTALAPAPVAVNPTPAASPTVPGPVTGAPSVTAAPTYTPPAPAPMQPPVAPAPTYTFEQVGRAGADLVAANPGLMNTLMSLMQRYGVQQVTELKPEQLGPFATELRGLGAKL